ncbi:MAG: hypothetical protein JSS02_23195 [Planctomycetes bacterium]|nr:hypothetical protein [Planctomycetota bacterium]
MTSGLRNTLRGWGLPLLEKELIEQAARKRTYVIRTVYASLLFIAAIMMFRDLLTVVNTQSLAALGQGRRLFHALATLQFIGIYTFVPALTCSTITQEKERDSLHLLILTRLGSWTILFEKLLSRLIPAFGFLLLSLPLLGFSYTLGGISPEYLAFGIWMLFISVIQMATLGLMCSVYFRTTASAFIASYLLGVLLLFGPAALWLLLGHHTGPPPGILAYPFFGAMQFFESGQWTVAVGGVSHPLLAAVAGTVPILFSIAVFLGLSRYYFIPRAFVPPRNQLREIFAALDRLFHSWNKNRWTRGVVLISDTTSLPDLEPIAWRETAKRSLGQFHYLLRLLLLLEIPIALLCVAMMLGDSLGRQHGLLLLAVFVTWGISVLMVAVHASNLVARERSHQTLEVLCTTPLTADEIVRQKFRSIWRLIGVLMIPMFTLIVFETWLRALGMVDTRGPNESSFQAVALYLATSLSTTLIYLPMFAWLSFLIGLKTKSPGRAIVGSLAAIVGWCLLPILSCILPIEALSRGTQFYQDAAIIMITSPLALIAINEVGAPPNIFETWIPLTVNCVLYGTALGLLRWWVKQAAPKAFFRDGAIDQPDDPISDLEPSNGPIFPAAQARET